MLLRKTVTLFSLQVHTLISGQVNASGKSQQFDYPEAVNV